MKNYLLHFCFTLTILGFASFMKAQERPTIYGTIIDGSTYGITAISPDGGILDTPDPLDSSFKFWGGFYFDGNLYAYNWGTKVVEIYDAETWMQSKPAFAVSHSNGLRGMTFDITTGTVYALTKPGTLWNGLSILNLQSGVTTQIGGEMAISTHAVSIAADKDGKIFILTADGNLYNVDKKTAVATLVGNTSITTGSAAHGAVFDHNTNELYWTPRSSTTSFVRLYKINTTTGVATLANPDIFEKKAQITSLFIKDPTANDDVPAKATDLLFTPSAAGSLTGKISFTVPSQSHSGSTLTGKLNGTIQIGSISIPLNNLTPGGKYTSAETAISQGGQNLIKITTSNTQGNGQTSYLSVWVGPDIPNAISNLVLSKEVGTGNPSISWDAPTTTEHEGFLDIANLKYKIVRLPDNSVVASAQTSTSFTESAPTTLNYYSYSVTPFVGDLYGTTVSSSELMFGQPHNVPFSEEITAASSRLWTIVDGNGDNNIWKYLASNALYSPTMSKEDGFDDWAFTPPMKLKPGVAYKISYEVKVVSKFSKTTERFKATYGKSTDPIDQRIISDYPEFNKNKANIEYQTFTEKIVVPSSDVDGDTYYFGFNACTKGKSSGGISIKSIKIDILAEKNAPAAVENLAVTTNGSTASITFNSPSTNVGGEALADQVSSFKIYKNNESTPIHTITEAGITPGKQFSWTDATPIIDVENTYKVIACNTSGAGLDASASIYVGIDIPKPVTDLLLSKNSNGDASLIWTAPTEGVNEGGLGSIQYKISRIIDKDTTVMNETYTQTSFVDNTVDKTNQNLVKYVVQAITSKGAGATTTSGIVRFGASYGIPYSESFADLSYAKSGWSTSSFWEIIKTHTDPEIAAPVDEDRGFLYCKGMNLSSGNITTITTPSLDLSNVENPVLKFYLFHAQHVSGTKYGTYLNVVASSDNNPFEKVTKDSILIEANSNGWTLYEIPLSQYKNKGNVVLGFEASSRSTGGFGIGLDKIVVESLSEKDLRIIAFNTPLNKIAGKTNRFAVDIVNVGVQTASDYSVNIYNGSEILDTQTTNPSIAFGDTTTIEFNMFFDLNEIGKSYQLKAEVVLDGDEDTSNNESNIIEAQIIAPFYPVAIDLEGEEDENNSVVLSWTAPTSLKKPVEVFDDFEDYTEFIIDNIGDWTMVDVDGKDTYVNEDYFTIPYANKTAPKAFQVFDYFKAGVSVLSGWKPYSGVKFLASFPILDLSVSSDDWAISPLLNGSAQTISFYARGVMRDAPEKFVVYYSSTDKELSSFIKLTESEYQTSNTVWTEYRYDLPLGAKHFAIRCISQNAITFLVDDVRYVAQSDDELELKGYNVYRNDEKINSELITTESFKDENPKTGLYQYNVTAVYDEGESAYSNPSKLNVESGIHSDYNKYVIYSERSSIIIEGAIGQTISIITIDGVTVAQQIADEEIVTIPFSRGLYLVKVGNKVEKLIVR